MDMKPSSSPMDHHATSHFKHQRISAVLLLPLTYWLLVLFHNALNLPYTETLAWLMSPLNAAAVMLWTILALYHAALGIQVVLEDYVTSLSRRSFFIRFIQFLFFVLGVAALAAIGFIFWVR